VKIRNRVAGENVEVRNLDDPSRVVTGKITVQPGAQFPWHIHPGPVLVTIASGELTYVDGDDCSQRVYTTGTAFFDVGNHVHSAFNPGTTEMVLYATWFDAPANGALTIPVDAPACA
jgi:quercetin dioxygenase-like cupin family protein